MKKALHAIRNRIRTLRAAKGLLLGASVGAAGCFALMILSFFVPIESIAMYLLLVFCVPPCALMAVSFLLPVSDQTAARAADGCGLQERIITALAFEPDKTPMLRLQRQNAEQRLHALPVRKALPIHYKRKQVLFVLALLSLCGALFLLPNRMHGVLRDREQTRMQLQAQAERIEKAAESVQKTGLTEKEQNELRRISSEMVRELRAAKDTQEALLGIDRLQADMDALQRQINERKTEDTQSLASQPALKSLSDALQSGDGSQMDQALMELAEALSNAEQKEAIANQMELAAELSQATEMQQALESAAEALKAGNMQAAMQALSAMAQSAGGAGNSLSALMQMARLGAAQAGSSGTNGSAASSGTQGFGSKAGLGTTQLDQGYREGFSQSAGTYGTGEIREKVGEYERIYDPTRLGGDNEASVVPGEMGEGDSQQMELGPGVGSFAGSVPYDQVILEYQEAAAQAINRMILPAAQQDWVTKYFDALIQ